MRRWRRRGVPPHGISDIRSSSKKPSRLGQWDGRRRSSRSEEPLLPQLCAAPSCSGSAVRAGHGPVRDAAGLVLGRRRCLPRRRDLPATTCGRASTSRSSTRCRPTAAATRPSKQLPPSSAATRRAARPCARPCRPSSTATRPAPCWSSAASRSPTRSTPSAKTETTAFLASQRRADHIAPRRRPVPRLHACWSSLVVLYVVRFQHSLAAEPAQGRRRLRPGRC